MPRSTSDSKLYGESYEDRLTEAARLAKARLARQADPDGRWEGGVWVPSDSERQTCCQEVAPPEPIPGRQQTLENHCRTLGHIAHLKGVEPQDLRRKWRELGFSTRASRSKSSDEPESPAELKGLSDLLRELRDLRLQLSSVIAEIEDRIEAIIEALGGRPRDSAAGDELAQQPESRSLDSRLHLPVGKRDKGRWMRKAQEEDLDGSQWIRRILNRTRGPLSGVPEDRPLNETLELRVNGQDKQRWEQLAQKEGLGLAQWTRRALNLAAREKPN